MADGQADDLLEAAHSLIQEMGADVIFEGWVYRAIVEDANIGKTGANFLHHQSLGAYIASADPKLFRFSPKDFNPWATGDPPREGQFILWHDLKYLVTAVSYEDAADQTIGIEVYTYRYVVPPL
jgi:hypothetical protein